MPSCLDNVSKKASSIFGGVLTNPSKLVGMDLLDISNEESTIIADAIQATLVVNPKISPFAHAHLSVSNAGAVATAYGSICVCGFKVRKSNTDLCSVWNVYCDCPPPMSFNACL
jgi:hypothetical protein